jgi:hypothetical protein
MADAILTAGGLRAIRAQKWYSLSLTWHTKRASPKFGKSPMRKLYFKSIDKFQWREYNVITIKEMRYSQ